MELAFRIGLLVVLWVFVFAVLRELRRDLSGVGGAPAAPVMTARGSASALPSPSAGGVQDAATAASPSHFCWPVACGAAGACVGCYYCGPDGVEDGLS